MQTNFTKLYCFVFANLLFSIQESKINTKLCLKISQQMKYYYTQSTYPARENPSGAFFARFSTMMSVTAEQAKLRLDSL